MSSHKDEQKEPRFYIPTLDGWRAVAIALVIAMHCRPALLNSGTELGRKVAGLLMHTAYGVDIFFALSGYLICTLLLSEKASTGLIHLRRFYVKRSFRILPPLLAYLAVLALLGWLEVLPGLLPEQFIAVLAFIRNYFPTGGTWWYTDHFWSLAIEEHFYLAIPLLLALVGWEVALASLVSLAFLSAGIRHFEVSTLSGLSSPVEFRTESRVDALMYGAILAAFLHRTASRNWIAKHLSPIKVSIIMAVAIGATLAWSYSPGRRTIIAIAIPICIGFTVLHPHRLLARALELPPVRWLGRLSYSLYIWQMLFLVPEERPLGWFQEFPQAPIMAFGCAVVSYHALEKPMIRLGRYLTKPSLAATPPAS